MSNSSGVSVSRHQQISADIAVLWEAMKGLGTDEDTLIRMLCGRSRKYLHDLQIEWNLRVATKQYDMKTKLVEMVQSETSGDFKRVLLSRLTDRSERKAALLYQALMPRWFIDYRVVISILCTESTHGLEKLQDTFKRQYQVSLRELIQDKISGHVGRLLVLRLEKKDDGAHYRPDWGSKSPSNSRGLDEIAVSDAKVLFEAGEGKFGVDEQKFIEFCVLSSPDHVSRVQVAYQLKTGHNLTKAIRKQTSGHLRDALLACILSPEEHYTNELYEAMKGLGTDDSTLIRIITLCSRKQLNRISHIYAVKHGKTIETDFYHELSGDYRKSILELFSFAFSSSSTLTPSLTDSAY